MSVTPRDDRTGHGATLDLAQLLALPDDAVITGPEVATLLRCSLTTFHARRRGHEFPVREVSPRLDRKPRWRLGDVRAFIRGEYPLRQGARRVA